jgi:hypothetical protein
MAQSAKGFHIHFADYKALKELRQANQNQKSRIIISSFA